MQKCYMAPYTMAGPPDTDSRPCDSLRIFPSRTIAAEVPKVAALAYGHLLGIETQLIWRVHKYICVRCAACPVTANGRLSEI